MLYTVKVSDYFSKIFSFNPFNSNKLETKYVCWFIVTGPESTVKFLIENGADINAVDNENSSALIEAMKNGKLFEKCFNAKKS